VTHDKPSCIQRKPLASLFAGRLPAWAGVYLSAAVVGACANQASTAEPASGQNATGALAAGGAAASTPAPAPTSVAAAPAPAAAAEPTVHARQQTPTTRSFMLTHYADTVAMRRALVSGGLQEFRAAAAAVAADPWTPRLRGDYRAPLEAVHSAARAAQQAPTVLAGTAALAKLGEQCASCHLRFGGPGSPVAPEQMAQTADPSMIAHAAATERLWEGLVLPSDTSWSSGMDVLLDAPKLDSDVADVAAAARHLQALARKGKSAAVEERGPIFASVLTTCAGCHERLGVSLRPTPSP
jgi:hypothetical protein